MAKNTDPVIFVRVNEDLHARLKATAADDDRSLASVVRIALREYVESYGT